jgi:hypothetical protein
MPVRRWLPVLALALVATTPGLARPGGAVVIAWNDPATGRGALAAMRGTPPWDLLTPVLEVGRDATVRASGRLVYATSPVDGTMVYSLSHVALPFPLSDGLYGLKPDPAERFGIHLGTLTARGELGILVVNPNASIRLLSNPFFPYLLERIADVTAGAR